MIRILLCSLLFLTLLETEGGESRIQTVTVNGMEGRLYSVADASQLVLLGDYLFLEFTYQGSISPEEFLALAALVER